jgi:hypothetical protein
MLKITTNILNRDLLSQQKIEREELKQTQKEILDKIITRQKEEVEPHKPSSNSTNSYSYDKMIEEQREERQKIVQLQTEEREKQMQIQADERKNFKP